jgi:F-type H+-transporting ATPase subunit delta
MSHALANQYAKAMLDVVSQPGSTVKPEEVTGQIASFAEVLDGSQDLRTALLSPALSSETKEKIIGRLAGPANLGRETQRFLAVVARKRRLNLLKEMQSAFQSLLDERNGVLRARVTSAAEIGGEQKTNLEAKLRQISGKNVTCEYQVDGALLGGVSVQMGAKVYDGSILGQMEALQRRLAAEL